MRRDKEARTVERNSSVSRSERKKTITIDSDDRSNTSERDIDEQKDESEGQKKQKMHGERKDMCQHCFLKYSYTKFIRKGDSMSAK